MRIAAKASSRIWVIKVRLRFGTHLWSPRKQVGLLVGGAGVKEERKGGIGAVQRSLGVEEGWPRGTGAATQSFLGC